MSTGTMERTRTRGGRPTRRSPWGPGQPGDEDRDILIAMLETMRRELYEFVHNPKLLFHPITRPHFPGPWAEVNVRFDQAIATLQEDYPRLFPQLRQAGLTGEMLLFKNGRLQQHVASVQDAILTYPQNLGWSRRVSGWLFATMNSILGSLTGALPMLEAVKEYKDHVEISVETMNRGSTLCGA